ncbi:MAG: SIMPL domain-containing protein [Bacteroidales bacterium]|nr:SIMPL domain-containing protein [Candidatus Latescibacterota bacterium]
MKRLSMAVIFVMVFYSVPSAAWAQESEKDDPEIVATGAGRVEADPESARVVINIRGFGETVDEAAEVCVSNYTYLLDTLKAAGIRAERIITRHFNSYPEPHRKKRNKIIGYWMVHDSFIDTKDLGEVRKIVDQVLRSGVASASVTWSLSSRADSVRSEALKEATLNAVVEAESMASAAGGVLGELIELTTIYPENPKFPTRNVVEALALKGGIVKRSSITPQKIKVHVSVLGRWRLIGGFEN